MSISASRSESVPPHSSVMINLEPWQGELHLHNSVKQAADDLSDKIDAGDEQAMQQLVDLAEAVKNGEIPIDEPVVPAEKLNRVQRTLNWLFPVD